MEYDEPTILTDYVWDYCPQVFTRFERDVWQADKWKHIYSRESLIHVLKKRRTLAYVLRGYFYTSRYMNKVADAAFGDLNSFKELVRDRVVMAHPEVVKRCPNCQKVLRTPKAKQCRWCFLDWHNSRPH